MRLWHKDLIPYLPKQQLVSQYRECCAIARSLALKGTPNHVLVNRVLDYSINHFIAYTNLVIDQMQARGYRVDVTKFLNWITLIKNNDTSEVSCIYSNWHNDVYLRQCLYNLEEKAICDAIPVGEWKVIYEHFKNFTLLWNGEQI